MTYFIPHLAEKCLQDQAIATRALHVSETLTHALRRYVSRLIDVPGGFDDLDGRLPVLDRKFEVLFRRAQAEDRLNAAHDPQALSQLTTALIANLGLRRRGGASDAALHRIAEITL
eukprot:gene14099-17847_t